MLTTTAIPTDYASHLTIMEMSNKEIKRTAQGVLEPQGPVGGSSGVPGSTRGLSSDWANDERRVEPRAPS
jgi:hypothetical protein